MERRVTMVTTGTKDDARCIVCGSPSVVSLCSLSCRAAAREEAVRNQDRIERLRGHGFDACLDEVQSVVRRNLQLVRALDDPSLVEMVG